MGKKRAGKTGYTLVQGNGRKYWKKTNSDINQMNQSCSTQNFVQTRMEVEHDNELVEFWSDISKKYQSVQAINKRMDSFLRERESLAGFAAKNVDHTKEEILEDFSLIPEDNSYFRLLVKNQKEIEDKEEEIQEAMEQYYEKMHEYRQHEELYNGWSRFYIVQNTNGHIHSSMNCSSCYPTTMFGFVPDLSGSSEEEAVEKLGTVLCTICFPSAPSEYSQGVSKFEASQKEISQEEKAVMKLPEYKKWQKKVQDVKHRNSNIRRAKERIEDNQMFLQDPGFDSERANKTIAEAEAYVLKAEKQLTNHVAKLEELEKEYLEVLTEKGYRDLETLQGLKEEHVYPEMSRIMMQE